MKLHEGYDHSTITNDICLLFLDGEADFSSPNIGPIALPANGEYLSREDEKKRNETKVRNTLREPSA